MKNSSTFIVSDFDGVIANTLKLTLTILQEIIASVDKSAKIESFKDYYTYLGKHSLMNSITPQSAKELRQLHRKEMFQRARRIRSFAGVVQTFARLQKPAPIVSSSLSTTIYCVLGKQSMHFGPVHGAESGRKAQLLEKLKTKGEFFYVTDTARDTELCKTLDIGTIGCSWGYDGESKLLKANPDFIVHTPAELAKTFGSPNL